MHQLTIFFGNNHLNSLLWLQIINLQVIIHNKKNKNNTFQTLLINVSNICWIFQTRPNYFSTINYQFIGRYSRYNINRYRVKQ